MTSISMVEFRRNAEGVLRRIEQGEHLILTYRGRPVARFFHRDTVDSLFMRSYIMAHEDRHSTSGGDDG